VLGSPIALVFIVGGVGKFIQILSRAVQPENILEDKRHIDM